NEERAPHASLEHSPPQHRSSRSLATTLVSSFAGGLVSMHSTLSTSTGRGLAGHSAVHTALAWHSVGRESPHAKRAPMPEIIGPEQGPSRRRHPARRTARSVGG